MNADKWLLGSREHQQLKKCYRRVYVVVPMVCDCVGTWLKHAKTSVLLQPVVFWWGVHIRLIKSQYCLLYQTLVCYGLGLCYISWFWPLKASIKSTKTVLGHLLTNIPPNAVTHKKMNCIDNDVTVALFITLFFFFLIIRHVL